MRPGGAAGRLGTLATVDVEPNDAGLPAAGAPAAGVPGHPELAQIRSRIAEGGAARYHEAAAANGKLFARDRIALLADAGSFSEDGAFANVLADGLPADGVITGTATVGGRPVALMANDSTVKAGSWGARTVEKIIRIIERAYAASIPMIYLVDSAGARITDLVDMFPGRRGAGKIFHTQVRASGSIPQACALFGPSAAGGAYIPAFCDFVSMVEKNASMYLGSPRMVEMVVKERTTLEEMGGARMHCTVSGCGHHLAGSEGEAIEAVRSYLSYLPGNWQQQPPAAAARAPKPADLWALVPVSEGQAYCLRGYVARLVEGGAPATSSRRGGRRAPPSRPTCGRSCLSASGRPMTCAPTCAGWSTPSRCSRSTRCGPGSLSLGSPGWTARSSAWWRTTRCSRAACCSLTQPTRPPGSSSSAMPSTCRDRKSTRLNSS